MLSVLHGIGMGYMLKSTLQEGEPALTWAPMLGLASVAMFRAGLSRMADQQRARLLLGRTAAALSIGVYVCLVAMARHRAAPGWIMLCSIALSWVVLVGFVRTVGLDPSHRGSILVIAAVGMACRSANNCSKASGISSLIQTLILWNAMLCGDFIGWLVDAQLRTAFLARLKALRGDVDTPPPAVPATMDDNPSIHPLSLNFSDASVEDAYSTERFRNCFPPFVLMCLVVT
eukprot:3736379-Prymnesium_polylepis.1